MRTPLAVVAATAVSLLVAPSASTADAQAAPPPATVRAGYRQSLTINPFGIPWGFVNAEYERAIGGGATVGLSGSHIGVDEEDTMTSIEGKVRYYPSENGLRGFSIGLGAGYTRIEDGDNFVVPPLPGVIGGRRDVDVIEGPALSVSADYNWLLGKRRRFVVGVGLGGKRIFTDDRPERSYIWDRRAYPTARFVTGLAF